MKTKEISEILLGMDIKPSYPRIQIYKYLEENRTHPTVEEIHNYLLGKIPTLSKTTVYNTLDLFDEKELIKTLNLGDNESRYEKITEKHSHFRCDKCDKIMDVPYKDIDFLPEGYEDLIITEKHILLRGICGECSSDN